MAHINKSEYLRYCDTLRNVVQNPRPSNDDIADYRFFIKALKKAKLDIPEDCIMPSNMKAYNSQSELGALIIYAFEFHFDKSEWANPSQKVSAWKGMIYKHLKDKGVSVSRMVSSLAKNNLNTTISVIFRMIENIKDEQLTQEERDHLNMTFFGVK